MPKNEEQHAAFLREFPLGSRAARDMLSWLQELPLFLDMGSFRIAHACWSDVAIDAVRTLAPDGVLRDDLLVEAADVGGTFGAAVDVLAKGPEADMPEGCSFIDRTGVRRTRTRVAWWNGGSGMLCGSSTTSAGRAPLSRRPYSPIRPDENGNQSAYLAAVPVEMAQAVISLLGAHWAEIDRGAASEPAHQIETIEASEEEVERELRNCIDLDEPEKLQLVKARGGHPCRKAHTFCRPVRARLSSGWR